MSGPGSDYSYKSMNCKNRTLGEVDDEVIAGTIKKYKISYKVMTDLYAVEGGCDWNLIKEVPITLATTDQMMKDFWLQRCSYNTS